MAGLIVVVVPINETADSIVADLNDGANLQLQPKYLGHLTRSVLLGNWYHGPSRFRSPLAIVPKIFEETADA